MEKQELKEADLAKKNNQVIECLACKKNNRQSANYCKFCGTKINTKAKVEELNSQIIQLSELIGLDNVKSDIETLINKIKIRDERIKKGLPTFPIILHTVLKGDTGTGKTLVSNILAKVYKSLGIVEKESLLLVSPNELQQQDLKSILKKAKNSVVCFDEIHRNVEKIGEIVHEIQFLDEGTVIIIAGLPEKIDKYFLDNPDSRNRFSLNYFLPNFSPDQLVQITNQKFKSKGFYLTDGVNDSLLRFFTQSANNGKQVYKNGWLVEKEVIPSIQANQSNRLSIELKGNPNLDLSEIKVQDVPKSFSNSLSKNEIFQSLDNLIGLKDLKVQIQKIAQTVEIQQERMKAGLDSGKGIGVHFVFSGNPGTGKTTVARMLGNLLQSIGYLPSGHVVEVDRSKLVAQYVGQTAPNVNKKFDDAIGGILFIDEAYTLVGVDGQKDTFGQEAIDTILTRMENDRGKVVVIIAGYEEPINRFLASNEGLNSRFTHFLNFQDYNPEELTEIFLSLVKNNHYILGENTKEKVEKVIQDIHRKKDKKFANARTIRNLYEQIVQEQSARLSTINASERNIEILKTILPEDIPFKTEENVPLEKIMDEMNDLIGLSDLKNEINLLLDFVNMQKKRRELGGVANDLSLHFVFTGNPGTGKTTVARILAKIFKNIGILPEDKLIEVDKSGLVGQYVGSTPAKVNAVVDSAIGGVLFIDEAYTLAPEGHSDHFSKEAIDTLLKRLEDDRGKFICIVAGYSEEMKGFLNSNPGLKSRFTRYLNFQDYSSSELLEIFKRLTSREGYQISDDAEKSLDNHFKQLTLNKGKDFANARTIRNLFELAKTKHASRLSRVIKNEVENLSDISLLNSEDVQFNEESTTEKTLSQSLETLNSLIGLGSVKNQISDLIAYIEVEKKRKEIGIKDSNLTLHFVFSGSPGTGKTTVARVLADIFKALGLLSQGHLIEVDRRALVGQYVGETAQKTSSIIDQAIGGILFIDEAYTLTPKGSSNDFGKEAIDILLKRMEDDRGKFIVIAAGYEDEMQMFVESNPGLRSRFTKFIQFENYNSLELSEIFKSLLSKKGLKLDKRVNLVEYMDKLLRNADHTFANGRTVRNLFEEVLQRQAKRILPKMDELSTEEKITITSMDMA